MTETIGASAEFDWKAIDLSKSSSGMLSSNTTMSRVAAIVRVVSQIMCVATVLAYPCAVSVVLGITNVLVIYIDIWAMYAVQAAFAGIAGILAGVLRETQETPPSALASVRPVWVFAMCAALVFSLNVLKAYLGRLTLGKKELRGSRSMELLPFSVLSRWDPREMMARSAARPHDPLAVLHPFLVAAANYCVLLVPYNVCWYTNLVCVVAAFAHTLFVTVLRKYWGSKLLCLGMNLGAAIVSAAKSPASAWIPLLVASLVLLEDHRGPCGKITEFCKPNMFLMFPVILNAVMIVTAPTDDWYISIFLVVIFTALVGLTLLVAVPVLSENAVKALSTILLFIMGVFSICYAAVELAADSKGSAGQTVSATPTPVVNASDPMAKVVVFKLTAYLYIYSCACVATLFTDSRVHQKRGVLLQVADKQHAAGTAHTTGTTPTGGTPILESSRVTDSAARNGNAGGTISSSSLRDDAVTSFLWRTFGPHLPFIAFFLQSTAVFVNTMVTPPSIFALVMQSLLILSTAGLFGVKYIREWLPVPQATRLQAATALVATVWFFVTAPAKKIGYQWENIIPGLVLCTCGPLVGSISTWAAQYESEQAELAVKKRLTEQHAEGFGSIGSSGNRRLAQFPAYIAPHPLEWLTPYFPARAAIGLFSASFVVVALVKADLYSLIYLVMATVVAVLGRIRPSVTLVMLTMNVAGLIVIWQTILFYMTPKSIQDTIEQHCGMMRSCMDDWQRFVIAPPNATGRTALDLVRTTTKLWIIDYLNLGTTIERAPSLKWNEHLSIFAPLVVGFVALEIMDAVGQSRPRQKTPAELAATHPSLMRRMFNAVCASCSRWASGDRFLGYRGAAAVLPHLIRIALLLALADVLMHVDGSSFIPLLTLAMMLCTVLGSRRLGAGLTLLMALSYCGALLLFQTPTIDCPHAKGDFTCSAYGKKNPGMLLMSAIRRQQGAFTHHSDLKDEEAKKKYALDPLGKKSSKPFELRLDPKKIEEATQRRENRAERRRSGLTGSPNPEEQFLGETEGYSNFGESYPNGQSFSNGEWGQTSQSSRNGQSSRDGQSMGKGRWTAEGDWTTGPYTSYELHQIELARGRGEYEEDEDVPPRNNEEEEDYDDGEDGEVLTPPTSTRNFAEDSAFVEARQSKRTDRKPSEATSMATSSSSRPVNTKSNSDKKKVTIAATGDEEAEEGKDAEETDPAKKSSGPKSGSSGPKGSSGSKGGSTKGGSGSSGAPSGPGGSAPGPGAAPPAPAQKRDTTPPVPEVFCPALQTLNAHCLSHGSISQRSARLAFFGLYKLERYEQDEYYKFHKEWRARSLTPTYVGYRAYAAWMPYLFVALALAFANYVSDPKLSASARTSGERKDRGEPLIGDRKRVDDLDGRITDGEGDDQSSYPVEFSQPPSKFSLDRSELIAYRRLMVKRLGDVKTYVDSCAIKMFYASFVTRVSSVLSLSQKAQQASSAAEHSTELSDSLIPRLLVDCADGDIDKFRALVDAFHSKGTFGDFASICLRDSNPTQLGRLVARASAIASPPEAAASGGLASASSPPAIPNQPTSASLVALPPSGNSDAKLSGSSQTSPRSAPGEAVEDLRDIVNFGRREVSTVIYGAKSLVARMICDAAFVRSKEEPLDLHRKADGMASLLLKAIYSQSALVAALVLGVCIVCNPCVLTMGRGIFGMLVLTVLGRPYPSKTFVWALIVSSLTLVVLQVAFNSPFVCTLSDLTRPLNPGELYADGPITDLYGQCERQNRVHASGVELVLGLFKVNHPSSVKVYKISYKSLGVLIIGEVMLVLALLLHRSFRISIGSWTWTKPRSSGSSDNQVAESDSSCLSVEKADDVKETLGIPFSHLSRTEQIRKIANLTSETKRFFDHGPSLEDHDATQSRPHGRDAQSALARSTAQSRATDRATLDSMLNRSTVSSTNVASTGPAVASTNPDTAQLVSAPEPKRKPKRKTFGEKMHEFITGGFHVSLVDLYPVTFVTALAMWLLVLLVNEKMTIQYSAVSTSLATFLISHFILIVGDRLLARMHFHRPRSGLVVLARVILPLGAFLCGVAVIVSEAYGTDFVPYRPVYKSKRQTSYVLLFQVFTVAHLAQCMWGAPVYKENGVLAGFDYRQGPGSRTTASGESPTSNAYRQTPKAPSALAYLMFIVYTTVPFLDEISNVIEWTVCKCSLELREFFLLADAHTHLWDALYGVQTQSPTKELISGRKAPLRIATGFISLLIWIMVIALPLLMFSSIALPPGQSYVSAATLTISASFHSHGRHATVTLYEADGVAGFPATTDSQTSQHLAQHPHDMVQEFVFPTYSDKELHAKHMPHLRLMIENADMIEVDATVKFQRSILKRRGSSELERVSAKLGLSHGPSAAEPEATGTLAKPGDPSAKRDKATPFERRRPTEFAGTQAATQIYSTQVCMSDAPGQCQSPMSNLKQGESGLTNRNAFLQVLDGLQSWLLAIRVPKNFYLTTEMETTATGQEASRGLSLVVEPRGSSSFMAAALHSESKFIFTSIPVEPTGGAPVGGAPGSKGGKDPKGGKGTETAGKGPEGEIPEEGKPEGKPEGRKLTGGATPTSPSGGSPSGSGVGVSPTSPASPDGSTPPPAGGAGTGPAALTLVNPEELKKKKAAAIADWARRIRASAGPPADAKAAGKGRPINMYFFSQPMYEGGAGAKIFGFSLVAVYIAIVATLGKFLRLAFDKASQRVIYANMARPDRILAIVRAVELARQVPGKHALRLERELFLRLILILRSPAVIIGICDSPNGIDEHVDLPQPQDDFSDTDDFARSQAQLAARLTRRRLVPVTAPPLGSAPVASQSQLSQPSH